jgi:hypothetical protein
MLTWLSCFSVNCLFVQVKDLIFNEYSYRFLFRMAVYSRGCSFLFPLKLFIIVLAMSSGVMT